MLKVGFKRPEKKTQNPTTKLLIPGYGVKKSLKLIVTNSTAKSEALRSADHKDRFELQEWNELLEIKRI